MKSIKKYIKQEGRGYADAPHLQLSPDIIYALGYPEAIFLVNKCISSTKYPQLSLSTI